MPVLVYSYFPCRQNMNWFDACRCGSGMLAPLSNLMSAMLAPVASSRHSIFSDTPCSDLGRHGMSLLCMSTSSRLGLSLDILISIVVDLVAPVGWATALILVIRVGKIVLRGCPRGKRLPAILPTLRPKIGRA